VEPIGRTITVRSCERLLFQLEVRGEVDLRGLLRLGVRSHGQRQTQATGLCRVRKATTLPCARRILQLR